MAKMDALELVSASSREKKPNAIMRGAAIILCSDCSLRYAITKRSQPSLSQVSITAYRTFEKVINSAITAPWLTYIPRTKDALKN